MSVLAWLAEAPPAAVTFTPTNPPGVVDVPWDVAVEPTVRARLDAIAAAFYACPRAERPSTRAPSTWWTAWAQVAEAYRAEDFAALLAGFGRLEQLLGSGEELAQQRQEADPCDAN